MKLSYVQMYNPKYKGRKRSLVELDDAIDEIIERNPDWVEKLIASLRRNKMKTITLRVEDCDQVVIDDLMDSYRMNNQFDKVDCSDDVLEPDYELLKAIQTVLAYYMVHKDWSEWMEMNPMVKEDA
jgi:hypothetical protein